MIGVYRRRQVGKTELIEQFFRERSMALTDDGCKRFIGTFEHRLSYEVTHPAFGSKVGYRRLLELQTRLLACHLAR